MMIINSFTPYLVTDQSLHPVYGVVFDKRRRCLDLVIITSYLKSVSYNPAPANLLAHVPFVPRRVVE